MSVSGLVNHLRQKADAVFLNVQAKIGGWTPARKRLEQRAPGMYRELHAMHEVRIGTPSIQKDGDGLSESIVIQAEISDQNSFQIVVTAPAELADAQGSASFVVIEKLGYVSMIRNQDPYLSPRRYVAHIVPALQNLLRRDVSPYGAYEL